jgi:hypothetical protein
MKKVLLTVLAGVLAGATFGPALAQDDAEKRFEFNGQVRARYDFLGNYLDLADNDSGSAVDDDSFGIAPYRVMVGITGMFAKNVTAHVDLQYTGHFGDEFNPSKDNPFFGSGIGGPINQGAAAYQFATQGVQLYAGWLELGKIGGSDFGVRVGRGEHTYGTELFMGDNDFYSGQTFDGLRGMWQHGASDLNFFYYKISENNCFGSCFGIDTSADSNLFGATYDWNFKSMGAVGGYVLVSQDLGGDGPVLFPDSTLMTVGARWNRGMMGTDKLNMFDWNIEYAIQDGDGGGPFGGPEVSIKSWIGEAWFAFNYKAGDSHGRVHIGTLMTSGDDTTTTDVEQFFPLYGDFHANNRLGDLDWVDEFGPSDITDFNAGYEHWFGDNHYVMFAYHMFQETEPNGAPEDKIGDEIDLKYVYKYSKNVAFEVMVGQAMGNDDFFGFATDPVQRAMGQVNLTW